MSEFGNDLLRKCAADAMVDNRRWTLNYVAELPSSQSASIGTLLYNADRIVSFVLEGKTTDEAVAAVKEPVE